VNLPGRVAGKEKTSEKTNRNDEPPRPWREKTAECGHSCRRRIVARKPMSRRARWGRDEIQRGGTEEGDDFSDQQRKKRGKGK